MSLEQVEQEGSLATMEDINEKTRNKLEKNGITELFPVQQATFDLFVKGAELIVK